MGSVTVFHLIIVLIKNNITQCRVLVILHVIGQLVLDNEVICQYKVLCCLTTPGLSKDIQRHVNIGHIRTVVLLTPDHSVTLWRKFVNIQGRRKLWKSKIHVHSHLGVLCIDCPFQVNL